MALPTSTSERGNELKYYAQKTTFGDATVANRPSYGFNDPQNGETVDADAAPEGKEAVAGATITALNANGQHQADILAGDGVHKVCRSYNPITDEFKVCEGEYVL